MSVKLAVVYYSTYGTNYEMASIAAAAAKAADWLLCSCAAALA